MAQHRRRKRPPRSFTASRQGSGGLWTLGIVIAVAIVGGIGILAMQSGESPSTGAMGAPIDIEPRVVSGPAVVGGVEVNATEVDFGRVPLDREVTQSFRLRNTTGAPVSLGSAAIETLEGC